MRLSRRAPYPVHATPSAALGAGLWAPCDSAGRAGPCAGPCALHPASTQRDALKPATPALLQCTLQGRVGDMCLSTHTGDSSTLHLHKRVQCGMHFSGYENAGGARGYTGPLVCVAEHVEVLGCQGRHPCTSMLQVCR